MSAPPSWQSQAGSTKPTSSVPHVSDSTANLESTLDLIRANLIEQGPLDFTEVMHEEQSGKDSISKFSVQRSDVSFDVPNCSLTVGAKVTRNGQTTFETFALSFRNVDEFVVRTDEESHTNLGLFTYHYDPPIFLVVARQAGKLVEGSPFLDKDVAGRVAKHMTGAELCGGRNRKDEPQNSASAANSANVSESQSNTFNHHQQNQSEPHIAQSSNGSDENISAKTFRRVRVRLGRQRVSFPNGPQGKDVSAIRE